MRRRSLYKNKEGNYLLDPYPVFGIYATHRLHTDHTKFATIKRSSDDVETDILFSDDAISLNSEVEAGGSLSSWLAGNSGNLTNLFDNIGGLDVPSTQPPRLVNNGVLDIKNGKAAIHFNGSQRFVRVGGSDKFQVGNEYTIFLVSSANSVGQLGAVFCTDQFSGERLVMFRDARNSVGRNTIHQSTTVQSNADLSQLRPTTDSVLTIVASNGDEISGWDNDAAGPQNLPISGTISHTGIVIGSQHANVTYLNGTFQALVFVEGFLPEADRNLIRDGLNAIYNCY